MLFVIVGEGLKRDAVREKAASLGLRDTVFLPFQPYPDLPGLLAGGDVLLVPLDKDKSRLSVPSKLYTFMAAGRPILGLATPDSEVAAVLREADCGPAVPPDDAAAIAAAIQTLARSPERRREQGGNARDYVVRRFAKGKILRSYEELLMSMVS
jgi:colanic acid biosynthesis glycosyl transferase WcaI